MAPFSKPLASCRRDVDGMAVIGLTRHDIMGIRYHSGTPGTGAPEGGGAPAPAPSPATDPNAPAPSNAPGTNPNTPPAAPAPTPNAPAADQNLGPDGRPWDAARGGARISALNTEARENREARETAERERNEAQAQTAAVLAALGIQPDGSAAPKTPEALTAELAQRNTAADTVARENLVLRSAATAIPGTTANVDKLLDSRSFTDKLSALKSDDRVGVESLIKEYVENDDSYKVTSAAAASGGAPHTGTTPTTTRKSLTAALDERFGKGATQK